MSTTPQEDRRRTGQGRRGTGTSTKRHGDRSPLLPRVSGHPVWVSRGGRRHGSRSTPWSSSPTLCPWSRFWTLLCRRWWNSCSRSSGSWTRRCWLSRSLWTVSRSALWTSLRSGGTIGGSADRLTLSSLQQTAEQIVDIPVPRGRDRRRLQGSLPGQSSTAAGVVQSVDIPVRGGLRGFLPGQDSQRTVEQLVVSSSGGLQDFHLSQGSTASSSGPADEAFTVFFHTFLQNKKVRSWLRTRVRECPPAAAHPRRLLSWRSRPCRTPSSGCGPGNATLARLASATDVLTVQSGRLQLVSRSCGTAKGMRRGGSGTGTGTRVSPRLTSLLFLLGEERYRQPRAVYKYWAGG